MRLLASLALLSALLLTACGGAPGSLLSSVPEDPAGPALVFGVPEGAEPADVAATLDARLQRAGLGRAAVDAGNASHVRCRLVAALDVVDARRLAARIGSRGELEFRIVAREPEQRFEAEKRESFEELYRLPPGHAWLPSVSGDDRLLEIPEQEAEAALRAAQQNPADLDRIAELQAALDAILAADVFGGADVVQAASQMQGTEALVFFEIVRDRKAAFADFTKRNLKRQIAIVVDGVVETAPVIQSPLPGEAVISGGGAGGFTPHEAAVLAAILSDDLVLPGDLELIRIEDPPPPAEEPR